MVGTWWPKWKNSWNPWFRWIPPLWSSRSRCSRRHSKNSMDK